MGPIINKYQGEPVKRQLTEGYNVTFHCDIESGKPRPTITWYYTWNNTDRKVDRLYDPRMSHPSDEEWTITGIQQSDKGRYRCVAENIAGRDDLRFEIIRVDGKFCSVSVFIACIRLILLEALIIQKCSRHENVNIVESRAGPVVTSLIFHQFGSGSIPSFGVICGLSLLALYSTPRGFSLGSKVFPPSLKTNV